MKNSEFRGPEAVALRETAKGKLSWVGIRFLRR
jgi:hypothetical protein